MFKRLFNKINSILASERYRVVIQNMLFLGLMQGVNFLVPLMIVPVLISRIGLEKFGLISLATATTSYFLILSDYGFNLTATRKVSVIRESAMDLSSILTSVMSIKFGLLFLGFLSLFSLTYLFDFFENYRLLYLLTFGFVIGQVLFPVWFFQGIEKMRYITLLNSGAKLVYFVLVLFYVQNEEDYLLVPFFLSCCTITMGLISQFIIRFKYKVKFVTPVLTDIRHFLYDGWYIFLSRIAVVAYTSGNIFILGVFAGNIAVGIYTVAQKVITAISTIGSIINRALFPNLSLEWKKDKIEFFDVVSKVVKIEIGIMLMTSIVLFLTSSIVVNFFSNEYVDESVLTLKILVWSVILIPLGGIFTQCFVTMEQNKLVVKTTMLSTLVNLLLVFVLINWFSYIGLAFTVILVQLFQVLINSYYFRKIKNRSICVE